MEQQTMNASKTAEAYVSIFQLQNGIFENAMNGIDDEVALQRPGNVNHINWLLGHVTTCRYMLANQIGLKIEDPYGKLYFSAISDEAEYPNLEAISKSWDTITPKLLDFIGNLNEVDLEREIPGNGVEIKNLIAFFSYHEAYHLGQIAYARKLLGVTPMKPY